MGYGRCCVYFFTGTGNSMRIAAWLGDLGRQRQLETIVSPLRDASPTRDLEPGPHQLLVMSMPTHGFTASWHVIKFAARLPRGAGTHAGVVASRAGVQIGSWQPPGVSASATFLIGLLLALRGYRIRGLLSVNMPSNWFSLHPIQGERARRFMLEAAQPTVHRFGERLLAGGTSFVTPSNVYELALTLLLWPVSLLYLLVGRFYLARLFFANTHC